MQKHLKNRLQLLKISLAEEHSRSCDLFIAIGSSLSVQPASLMPFYAKQGGSRLAIINFTETDYDSMADVLINEKASLVLTRLIRDVSCFNNDSGDP